MLRRNASSQTVAIGPLLDSNGSPINSGASAFVNESAASGTLTLIAGGCYTYQFTQGETDASILRLRVTGSNRTIVATYGTMNLDESGNIADLLAVKAKTDQIGTSSAIVSAPVSSQGKIAQIFIGDDYLAANGRSFNWTITAPTGFTAASSTTTFGGSDGNEHAWLASGTIVDNGSTWTLKHDLPKADSVELEPGTYEWTVEVKSSTGVEHTVSFGGDTKVRRKYT